MFAVPVLRFVALRQQGLTIHWLINTMMAVPNRKSQWGSIIFA
jgi:hypothetical protein